MTYISNQRFPYAAELSYLYACLYLQHYLTYTMDADVPLDVKSEHDTKASLISTESSTENEDPIFS